MSTIIAYYVGEVFKLRKPSSLQIKTFLILSTILLLVGVGLIATSSSPVSRGSYKGVYPISRLKEYASYGRGEYSKLADGYDLYVFYKQAFFFLDPGTYRLSFVIEAENFTHSTPYVLLTASFDDMGAGIGTTLDSVLGQESRITYTYDRFESKPVSTTGPVVPASTILLMKFLPQEQGGTVTVYFNTEPYETNLPQFIIGLVLVIGGTSSIALGTFKPTRQRANSNPRPS